MLKLTIFQPKNRLPITRGQMLIVAGQLIKEDRSDEGHIIESITVQLDSQPPIQAQFSDAKLKTVTFRAALMIKAPPDRHTITVTATNDNGQTAHGSVVVFTGPAYEIAPPAAVLEIALFLPFEQAPDVSHLDSLVHAVQGILKPTADAFGKIGKVLAGPHFVIAKDDNGMAVLRIGLWLEDNGFPVVPGYSFPRLLPEAAAAGFDLVPLLPKRAPDGNFPFAISLPTSTLQSLVDTNTPDLKASADSDFRILSATLRCTGDCCSASQISPMPPSPILRTRRYLPANSEPSSLRR